MKANLFVAIQLIATMALAQQNVLFNETEQQTLAFRPGNVQGPSATVIADILRTLQPAQGHGSFDLYYQYDLQVLEGSNDLQANIQWKNISIDRATQPFGFDFTDLLYPTAVVYSLELLAGDEIIRTEHLEHTLGNSLPSFQFRHSPKAGGVYYRLQVRNLQFKYDNRSMQQVRNRRQAIDRYRAARPALEVIRNTLDNMPHNTPPASELASVRSRFEQLERQFNDIERADFWQQLSLEGSTAYDPEELLPLRRQLAIDLTATRRWMDELAVNQHLLFFEEGMQYFRNGQFHNASRLFEQAVRHNDQFAPAHYCLAWIDFNDGRITDAAERTRLVLNRLQPDPQTREDARELARNIVRFHFAQGQAAVDAHRFEEGVALYMTAQQYSRSLHHFDFGQLEADSRIREALFLDFNSRVDVAVTLYRRQAYDEALKALDDALAFQQANAVASQYDTRQLQRNIVSDFYQHNLRHIRQLREQQQWATALQALDDTERLLRDYPGIIRDNQALTQERMRVAEGQYQAFYGQAEASIRNNLLDQALEEAQLAQRFVREQSMSRDFEAQSDTQIAKIQRLRYQRFIKGGEQAGQRGDWQAALEQYGQAQLLEQTYTYLRNTSDLAAKITLAAVQLINQTCDAAMQQNARNNEALQAVRSRIASTAQQYQISDNPTVQQRLQQLEEQICRNASEWMYPRLEDQLQQQMDKADFIAAAKTLQEMETMLRDYPSCGLSDYMLRYHKEVVTRCAEYQQTLQKALEAENRQQYGTAIVQYTLAARQYAQPDVTARFRPHPAFQLFPYIQSHSDWRMHLSGSEYFTEQRNIDKAVTLLRQVVERGVQPDRTESLQQRLGIAMASVLYSPASNWKETFYSYIPKATRKPYNVLYKAFRKQWKAL
ncbi:MAG: hypothetical protein R2795_24115 [Saprospiraceae bacterium]